MGKVGNIPGDGGDGTKETDFIRTPLMNGEITILREQDELECAK